MRSLHRTPRFVLLSLAALLAAGSAQACKVWRQPLSDYLQGQVPQAAVFRGTVVRVDVREPAGPTAEQRQQIRFRVSRWWTGERSKTVTVQGSVGSMKGTSCEGTFDFTAQPGEEWVVFGRRDKGGVKPDALNSVRIVDGVVPPAVAEALTLPPK